MPDDSDEENLIEQFPKDPIVSTIDEVLPDDLEHLYYDQVISLNRDAYSEQEALVRFPELCALRKAKAVGAPFRTAKFWCMRVIKL